MSSVADAVHPTEKHAGWVGGMARLARRTLGRWPRLLGTRVRLRGHDNRLSARGAWLQGCRIDVVGNHNRIDIAAGALLRGVHVYMRGDGHRLRIETAARLNAGSVCWFEDRDGCITIGRGTLIVAAALSVTEERGAIDIGADSMLAYDVEVRNGDSHPIFDLGSGERINPARDVHIEDHVWIGGRASILKGVRIGQGAVVALGAVVSRDVPPHTLVAGVPARVIRTGIRWTAERGQSHAACPDAIPAVSLSIANDPT